MKVTNILSLFTLASGLVYAKLDQCNELKASLGKKVESFECQMNQNGDIDKLNIGYGLMRKVDYDKIFSYNTIRDLTISHEEREVFKPEPYISDELNYLTKLKNLKNLKSLKIQYNVYKNARFDYGHIHYLTKIGKNTFKGLKNLKKLNLFGVRLSQDNINEIATLTNVESLDLNYCSFNDATDYSSLKNLKKVKHLSALINDLGYESKDGSQFEYSVVPGAFVNNFSSVKELQLTSAESFNYKKFTEIEKFDIDFVKNTSFLANYTNLKRLTIEPGNDLTVLAKVPSIVTLNIIHKPKSHGYGEFPYQDLNIKLSDKSNIKELYLNGINVTDKVMKELLKLKNVKSVLFINCKFSELSDKYYKKLSHFGGQCPIEVEFRQCSFGDRKHLKNFGCDTATAVTVCSDSDSSNCQPNETTTTTKKTTTKKSTTTKTIKKSTAKKSTTKKSTTKTTNKKVPTSTVSGRCGPDYGACAVSSSCCSKYGWCGHSSAHCGVGCQPKYGLCH